MIEFTELEANRVSLNAKTNKFNELIKKADDYFKKEDYENAKKNYSYALALFPKDAYAKQQVVKIDKALMNLD